MRRQAEIRAECRCGAALSVPANLHTTHSLVEMFLIEHSACKPSPPPPVPKVAKPPATEIRG